MTTPRTLTDAEIAAIRARAEAGVKFCEEAAGQGTGFPIEHNPFWKASVDCLALLARVETVEADYQETTERLQALCDKHGCEPGSNRFDWLDERLTKLASAAAQDTAMLELKHGNRDYSGDLPEKEDNSRG